MGWMRHHAIIVSSHGYEESDRALGDLHALATRLGACVSPISEPVTNGVRSFAVFSDGSKEGWGESDVGDSRRAAIKAAARKSNYDDGSGPLSWVEVQYGDDGLETLVLDDSDHERRDTAASRKE